MKKSTSILLIAAGAFSLSACNGLKRMQKQINKVQFTLTPNPLEVKGDEVNAKIDAAFPARYFNRYAKLTLTPQLVYNGKVVPYKSYALQGEKYPGNDQQISFLQGGKSNYTGAITFVAGMEQASLQLAISGQKGKKTLDFKPIEIGKGTVTTAFLVKNDDKVIIAPDQFKRITQSEQEFIINYLVNSSVVQGKELIDADVKQTQAFLKTVASNPNYSIQSVSIESYASPEGELRINESLAKDRGESAESVVLKLFKDGKVKASSGQVINLNPKGEDWEGFKSLMEKSKIADKALILRMLTMYEDPQKREQEIRNLSATFEEVAEQILPQLRRSTVTIAYQIQGRSDEQIMALAQSNPDKLSVEELLYAAKLSATAEEQERLYKAAAQLYPNDFRAVNNLGVLAFNKKDINSAKSKFQESNRIAENLYANNNLGVINRLEGDRAAAQKLISSAIANSNEAKYNLALVQLQNGEYGAAQLNMSGYNTYNSALVHLLAGQNDKALSALESSPDKNTADGFYLAAIIHHRSGNTAKCLEKLSKAISAESSYKAKANGDMEFVKLRSNPDFKAITQ
ncbi:MAG TPA: hypothetical protein VFV37_09000 [Luteibaculaceae bacterium]|nr:hypothetical protein [Luteibaculaceae bacterium]